MKKRIIIITTSVVLAIALCALTVENVRLTDLPDGNNILEYDVEGVDNNDPLDALNEVEVTPNVKEVDSVTKEVDSSGSVEVRSADDRVEVVEVIESIDTTAVEVTQPVELVEEMDVIVDEVNIEVETVVVDSVMTMTATPDSSVQTPSDTLVVVTELADSIINKTAE